MANKKWPVYTVPEYMPGIKLILLRQKLEDDCMRKIMNLPLSQIDPTIKPIIECPSSEENDVRPQKLQ